MEMMVSSFGLTRFAKMLLSWSNALRVMVLVGGRRELLVGNRRAAVRSLALESMR